MMIFHKCSKLCKNRISSLVLIIACVVLVFRIYLGDDNNSHTYTETDPLKIEEQNLIPPKVNFERRNNIALQKRQRLVCSMYKRELALTYKIEPYTFGKRNSGHNVITLLTQLSYSRLDKLQKIAIYWPGPISAALYVEEEEVSNKSHLQTIASWLHMTGRDNIFIHFVYANGTLYPINHLRNVAMDNTDSEYVFMIDIDFIPDRNLFITLQTAISNGFLKAEKEALVVPAFELLVNTSFPETKQIVHEYFQKEILISFHNNSYSPGHAATNITKWMTSRDNYKIEYQFEYEPYIVLKRKPCPRYNEKFLQRYWNKASHIYQLDTEGWTFTVLANGYLVHLPHPYSGDSDMIKRCAEREWNKFRVEMAAAAKRRSLSN